MEKSVKISQGRILPMPVRIVATIGFLVLIAWFLDNSTPEDATYLLPIIALSAIVPAFWTSRKVVEIRADHISLSYWWIMGRKFRKKELGQVTRYKVLAADSEEEAGISMFFVNGDSLQLIKSIPVEKLPTVVKSLQTVGLTE